MSTVTIIGAGVMASSLSFQLSENGHTTHLTGTPLDREIISQVEKNHYHPTLDRTLYDQVVPFQTEDMEKALSGCDAVICGVSSFGVDWFVNEALPLIPDHIPVISVTKGMMDQEDGSMKTFPELFEEKTPEGRHHDFCAIGGPCRCYEMADHDDTKVAFCGKNRDVLEFFRELLETDYYHIDLTDDVNGVEIAVAMKNCYALGVSLGIGLEEKEKHSMCNTQSALFGQSSYEIMKLVEFMGGKAENAVHGIGDLYVTVLGGRSREIGKRLGLGMAYEDAMKELEGMTLESVAIAKRAARAVRKSAQKGNICKEDFPLLLHIDEIITQGRPVNIPWKQFKIRG